MNFAVFIDNPEETEIIKSVIDARFQRAKQNYKISNFSESEPGFGFHGADAVFLDTSLTNDLYVAADKIRSFNPAVMLIAISDTPLHEDDIFKLELFWAMKRPIKKESLACAVEMALNRFNRETVCFYLKDKNTEDKILKDDIIFIEIKNRKTKIVTKGKDYYSAHPLKYWKKVLNDKNFISPHNSYIINMDYITCYNRNHFVILQHQHRVAIASSQHSAFHRVFTRYKENVIKQAVS